MPGLERQPFSTHMAGPRTPPEVSRARTNRRERVRAMEQIPLERLPEHDSLIRYLQRKGRGQDCTDEHHCAPERYEPTLMDDLYDAIRDKDADAVREVREVIWAGSSRLHPGTDSPTAVRLVEAIRQKLVSEQMLLERTHPDDADDLKQAVEELEETVALLRKQKTGEELETAVRTIEDWFVITLRRAGAIRGLPKVRDQAEKELASLRLVRDELYYARLFPNHAQLRNAATRRRR